MNRIERWLYTENIGKLLQSCDITRIEQAMSVQKDIITVSRAQYEESFPNSVKVRDVNASQPVLVSNPQFEHIPVLLKKQTVKNPVVITSVRKSAVYNDQLVFGKQYVVDAFSNEGVRIHYEHVGNGNSNSQGSMYNIVFCPFHPDTDKVKS